MIQQLSHHLDMPVLTCYVQRNKTIVARISGVDVSKIFFMLSIVLVKLYDVA